MLLHAVQLQLQRVLQGRLKFAGILVVRLDLLQISLEATVLLFCGSRRRDFPERFFVCLLRDRLNHFVTVIGDTTTVSVLLTCVFQKFVIL